MILVDWGNAGIISHQTTAYYPDGTARAFTRNMTETNGLVTAARREGPITTDDVIHLLGEKYPFADFTANGNIYCMRLYSRGLMEAEMR